MNKKSGFTIMELIIVIAIIAVMTAIAVPNYLSWIPEKRLRSAGDDLFSNLLYTKMQAIKHNVDWAVVFISPGNTYQIRSDFNGANTVVRTITLSSYGSGVSFGGGNSTQNIPNSGNVTLDGVSYPANIAVFNSRGMVDPGNLGYVYLTNEFGSAVAAGTPALSGVVVQRVWSGAAWQ